MRGAMSRRTQQQRRGWSLTRMSSVFSFSACRYTKMGTAPFSCNEPMTTGVPYTSRAAGVVTCGAIDANAVASTTTTNNTRALAIVCPARTATQRASHTTSRSPTDRPDDDTHCSTIYWATAATSCFKSFFLTEMVTNCTATGLSSNVNSALSLSATMLFAPSSWPAVSSCSVGYLLRVLRSVVISA